MENKTLANILLTVGAVALIATDKKYDGLAPVDRAAAASLQAFKCYMFGVALIAVPFGIFVLLSMLGLV